MKLGIFARSFVRPSLAETLGAIQSHGFETVQFNLSAAGLPTLPGRIEGPQLEDIHSAFANFGLEMCAVSGTFNTIHPDLSKRIQDTEKCATLIKACPSMGTQTVTLCTGTRDPDHMWSAHPDNDTPEAWRDLLNTLEILIEQADAADVSLGIEPEMANVINSAAKARKLLDEIKSPCLRIILDGANLLTHATLSRQREILSEAFDLLRPDIIMVHAKDFPVNETQTQAAGKGGVEFPFYLGLVRASGFNGPVVLHNLSEDEVPPSAAFVRGLLER
jgi:sugar phosphate isomerase/epimerase